MTWLLEGDPSVRWQVERDLLELPPEEWQRSRSRTAEGGWCRELLDHQDHGGTWGGGIYGPKWISTTYTLLLLRRLGLPAGNEQAIAGCERLLDDAVWDEGGVSYWSGRVLAERCVNGMVLSILSHFRVPDPRVDSIAEMLIRVPMADGGWNCEDYRGATHSSMHTTTSVLEGLDEWRKATGERGADDALAAGQEFLLAHRMFRSHRSGEVIDERWLQPHFPPRWFYDVLRGLDHLQESGAATDDRAAEAIEALRQRRRLDGRWSKGTQYGGRTFLTLEPGRVPGRINTLRALRVLRWWEGAARPDDSRRS